jgi:hypothetical protein
MDAETHHPHVHHHKLGIPWYDMALPVAALFVSLVSIFIAWHHGRVMQELVHENAKIVQAESLPYLDIYTSDLADDLKTPTLRLTVQNQGVGPARLAEVVLTVNGKPVPDFNTLVDHCCAPGLLQAKGSAAKQYRGIRNGEVVLSSLRDRMIRPGEAVDAFAWPITEANRPVLDRLQHGLASNAVNIAICYCSVFDECWIRTDQDRRPKPVKQCPIASVPYRQ